jgi:hypothetical protein
MRAEGAADNRSGPLNIQGPAPEAPRQCMRLPAQSMARKIAAAATMSSAGMSEWSITTIMAPDPQAFLSNA